MRLKRKDAVVAESPVKSKDVTSPQRVCPRRDAAKRVLDDSPLSSAGNKSVTTPKKSVGVHIADAAAAAMSPPSSSPSSSCKPAATASAASASSSSLPSLAHIKPAVKKVKEVCQRCSENVKHMMKSINDLTHTHSGEERQRVFRWSTILIIIMLICASETKVIICS